MVDALTPIRTTTLSKASFGPRAALVMKPRFAQDVSASDTVSEPKSKPSWKTTLVDWIKFPFKLLMAVAIGFVSMVIATWVERWVNDQLAPMMQGMVQQGQPAGSSPKADTVLPTANAPMNPVMMQALQKREPLPADFFTDPESVARQQALLIKVLKAHRHSLERGPRVTGWSPAGGGSLGLDSYRDKQGLTLRQWRVALLAQTLYTQLQHAKGLTEPVKSQHEAFWSTVFYDVFRFSGSKLSDKSITDTLKRFESSDPGKAKVLADPTWTLPQFWKQRSQATEQKPLLFSDEALVKPAVTELLESTVWPLLEPEPRKEMRSRVQGLPLTSPEVTQVAEGLSRQLGIKPVKTVTSALTKAQLTREADKVSQLAKKFGAAVWVWDSPLTELSDTIRTAAQSHVALLASNDRYPVWVLFPKP